MFYLIVVPQLTARPIYIINLILYILSCIGTALCPTNAYWLLLLLRIVQVSGLNVPLAGTDTTGCWWICYHSFGYRCDCRYTSTS
jgi:MFS family permease